MGFAAGLGKSVGEQVKNALELPFVIIDGVCIKLPLSLMQGIVNLVEDPQGTFEGTVGSVEDIVDKIKAIPTYIEQAPAAFQARLDEISAIEDPYEQGEALGKLVGNVLPAGVATSAFVGKTVKTVRGLNAVKKGASKGFSKVRKGVGKGGNQKKVTLKQAEVWRLQELRSGEISESNLMSTAEKWLGKEYKDMGNGRYLSKNGLRQFRYGKHETRKITKQHAHFETYDKSHEIGGKLIEKTVVDVIE